MPRTAQNRSAGDQITAALLNLLNADLDDLYANGSDRLRVRKAVSGTALRIDIGAGAFLIGNVKGTYAGGTDIAVTNSATNYVMIDSSGTIQISTSGRDDNNARLATVVCAGGVVTTVTNSKIDVRGGQPGSPLTWSTITAATKQMVNAEAYIANRATLITFTLPTTAAVGEKIAVSGLGVGGWRISQNASQNIRRGSVVTTTGTGGYILSGTQYDRIVLVCTTANTTWTVESYSGDIETDTGDSLMGNRASNAETLAETISDKAVTPAGLGERGELYGVEMIAGTANTAQTANTERSKTGSTYTKVKEFEVVKGGTFRTSFELKGSNNGAQFYYGRIYKNGVAYGAEHTTTSSSYSEKTDDLTFDDGDSCELWYKTQSGGDSVFVKNFKLMYDYQPRFKDNVNVTVTTD